MQIDADEQPTPRSAEWRAGWASATTTARSQVDVAREQADTLRHSESDILAECDALRFQNNTLRSELAAARELLEELFTETGYKQSYTAADGRLHPGATSTVAEVWRFLWGKGMAK